MQGLPGRAPHDGHSIDRYRSSASDRSDLLIGSPARAPAAPRAPAARAPRPPSPGTPAARAAYRCLHVVRNPDPVAPARCRAVRLPGESSRPPWAREAPDVLVEPCPMAPLDPLGSRAPIRLPEPPAGEPYDPTARPVSTPLELDGVPPIAP